MILPEQKSTRPIFIHSLFRSGSTYFFMLFRRLGSYWCYQEPLNEYLTNLDINPEALLALYKGEAIKLHHPDLDKPYFWEFYEIKDALKGLFKKNFSYDNYFIDETTDLPADQVAYFAALISHARGIPLLQLCRSGGRANAMKKSLGGTHIHLWREPRNQWWSYKIFDYFNATTHLIYNSTNLPEVLKVVKDRCGIAPFHSETIETELFFANSHPLNFRQSYFSFYALWLYSHISLQQAADVEICIDRLSNDIQYRQHAIHQLHKIGIEGIDFLDCNIPKMALSSEELGFYCEIEEQVRELFRQYGYTTDVLNSVQPHITDDNQSAYRLLIKNGKDLRRIIEILSNNLANAEARANSSETKLQHLYESVSWKITIPLRAVRQWLLRL